MLPSLSPFTLKILQKYFSLSAHSKESKNLKNMKKLILLPLYLNNTDPSSFANQQSHILSDDQSYPYQVLADQIEVNHQSTYFNLFSHFIVIYSFIITQLCIPLLFIKLFRIQYRHIYKLTCFRIGVVKTDYPNITRFFHALLGLKGTLQRFTNLQHAFRRSKWSYQRLLVGGKSLISTVRACA